LAGNFNPKKRRKLYFDPFLDFLNLSARLLQIVFMHALINDMAIKWINQREKGYVEKLCCAFWVFMNALKIK
jgi:hypothetical protein